VTDPIITSTIVTDGEGKRWQVAVLDRAPRAGEWGYWITEDQHWDPEELLASLMEGTTTREGVTDIEEIGWIAVRDMPRTDPQDDLITVTVEITEVAP
jgi:hypothetical protein